MCALHEIEYEKNPPEHVIAAAPTYHLMYLQSQITVG